MARRLWLSMLSQLPAAVDWINSSISILDTRHPGPAQRVSSHTAMVVSRTKGSIDSDV